jgi:C_GCAxxG_C_C family probable redox protein
MANPIQTAQNLFANGFNCSQAVFSAYAAQLGIDDETALKLASPFGGGVSHQGNVCGAVTGALMVLGLARGSASSDKGKKDETDHVAEDFIRRFQDLHGSILCRELTGYDISKPGEMEKAKGKSVFQKTCPGLVKDAAELISRFLDE